MSMLENKSLLTQIKENSNKEVKSKETNEVTCIFLFIYLFIDFTVNKVTCHELRAEGTGRV